MNDLYLALDLEMNQPSGKIIEIGAVVGNLRSGEIIDKFTVFINPEEPISQYIQTLTKIAQSDINIHGVSFEEGISKFFSFARRYEINRNVITWGGDDCNYLREQIKSHSLDVPWPFGRRIIDTKTIYQIYRFAFGEKPQSGLAKSCNRMNLPFMGTKHRAIDDALMTFKLLSRLVSLLGESHVK